MYGEVLPFDYVLYLFPQEFIALEKVAHTDALLHVFVRIDGGDAPSRGTELGIAEPVLLEDVEHLVVRHADDRLVADLEVPLGDLYAFLFKSSDLAHEMFYVYHHSVAHDVHRVLTENA